MRVVVLGAGVVGTATAYYLSQAGHDVVVVDRQPGAGLETSFANAGQVSPGYSSPWAAPGIPLKAVRWLLMKYRPLVLRPSLDPRLYAWLMHMLANCTEDAYRRNKRRMLLLAEYSRDCLRDLRERTHIEYDHRERGTLQLFRKPAQLDACAADTRVLADFGISHEVLDRQGCIRAEPALARVAEKFVGGLRLPGDETGDAHLFTQRLAALCESNGVRFRFGAAVSRLVADGSRIASAEIDTGKQLMGEQLLADAFVVALGSFTPKMLAALGLKIPIYPVKGYSLTMPIIDRDAAPVSTVMDETFKIGITRLGDRIRVGGTAELAGFDRILRAPRRATLAHSVNDLFPGGGDTSAATFWSGLRPMTPDGTPIVGATRFANLYTNTGHGTLGWTMACGSGRVLADIVSGRQPDIAHADLALARYA